MSSSLELFGLSEREQEVYWLLLRKGWSTALQLSRDSRVKRTTLYRVLDSLAKKGLVETQLDDKTTYYNAAEVKQFEQLVTSQEKKAAEMRRAYRGLQQRVKMEKKMSGGATAVRFFRGVRGLQHMEWKMCEGNNFEVLIFGVSRWHGYLGEDFAEEIREEMVKNNIRVRELMNSREDEGYETHKDGTASWTRNKEYVLKHYRCRLVPEGVMEIVEDIHIFGDTVHLRGYREHEVMGVELKNANYAKMLKGLFELVWGQVGEGGWLGKEFGE